MRAGRQVEFAGPLDRYSLLNDSAGDSDGAPAPGSGAMIRTTFSGDNHADLPVDSPELHGVPDIAT